MKNGARGVQNGARGVQNGARGLQNGARGIQKVAFFRASVLSGGVVQGTKNKNQKKIPYLLKEKKKESAIDIKGPI